MVPATCDIAQRLGRSEDSATPRDVADAQMEAKEAITIRGHARLCGLLPWLASCSESRIKAVCLAAELIFLSCGTRRCRRVVDDPDILEADVDNTWSWPATFADQVAMWLCGVMLCCLSHCCTR